MRVKSLHLTRNPYTWDDNGTPPGEIGGEVVLASDAGELRIRLKPDQVDAILATVAGGVAARARSLASDVNPALVRNARSEALLLEALAEPITPAQEALVAEVTGEADPVVEAALDNGFPGLAASLAVPPEIAPGQVWRNRRGAEVEIATASHEDETYPVEGHELANLGGARLYTAKGRYFSDADGEESEEDLVTFLRTKAAADAPVA